MFAQPKAHDARSAHFGNACSYHCTNCTSPTYTDAGDFAADYSTLTRASLNVEQDFKKQAFVADGVLVITFDRVINVDGAPVC